MVEGEREHVQQKGAGVTCCYGDSNLLLCCLRCSHAYSIIRLRQRLFITLAMVLHLLLVVTWLTWQESVILTLVPGSDVLRMEAKLNILELNCDPKTSFILWLMWAASRPEDHLGYQTSSGLRTAVSGSWKERLWIPFFHWCCDQKTELTSGKTIFLPLRIQNS